MDIQDDPYIPTKLRITKSFNVVGKYGMYVGH